MALNHKILCFRCKHNEDWKHIVHIDGGKPPMTASGGSLFGGFLMRNKRSAQWAVAPIEHADHRFESCCDHHKPLKTLRFRGFFIFPGGRYVHFGELKWTESITPFTSKNRWFPNDTFFSPARRGVQNPGVFTVLHNKVPASWDTRVGVAQVTGTLCRGERCDRNRCGSRAGNRARQWSKVNPQKKL